MPITLERCRQILGDDEKLTDAELERLRDALSQLAVLVVDAHLERMRGTGRPDSANKKEERPDRR